MVIFFSIWAAIIAMSMSFALGHRVGKRKMRVVYRPEVLVIPYGRSKLDGKQKVTKH